MSAQEPEVDDVAMLEASARNACGSGCDEALERLFEYLDAELEAPDAERVRAHLDECAPCLEEYDVETVVKNLVRRCCQEEAPSTLRLRIHEQLTVLRVRSTDG